MKSMRGQPNGGRFGDFLTVMRRLRPTGVVPRSPLRAVTVVTLMALSLSTLSLVIAEMPVSATAPGTTFLTPHASAFALNSTVQRPASRATSSVAIRPVTSSRTVAPSSKRAGSAVPHHSSTSTLSSTASPLSTKNKAPTRSTSTTPTSTTTTTIAPTNGTDTSTGTSITAPTTSTSTTTTTVPTPTFRITNPVVNIAPSPNFLDSGQCTNSGGSWTCANPCVTNVLKWPSFSNGVGCTNYILEAINVARADEGLVAMALPSNWYSLTTTQQLFVVANLERTARGLPPYLGLNAALSADAQQAAQTNSDPSVAPGFAIGNDAQGVPGMGGAWAGGFAVLAADYIWMYDDGWGGSAANTSNVACTSATATGCWAHRDELLGSDPGYNPGVGLNCQDCEMGTGFAIVNGSSSFVDLIEIPKGAPPAMTFTWAEELSQGF
jgi:hypothetical protein